MYSLPGGRVKDDRTCVVPKLSAINDSMGLHQTPSHGDASATTAMHPMPHCRTDAPPKQRAFIPSCETVISTREIGSGCHQNHGYQHSHRNETTQGSVNGRSVKPSERFSMASSIEDWNSEIETKG